MYVLWAMMLFLFMYILRALIGPSVWDRLLAMTVMSTKVIVIIVVFASVRDRAYLLDFAIIYALFGFICPVFIALFLSEKKSKRKKV